MSRKGNLGKRKQSQIGEASIPYTPIPTTGNPCIARPSSNLTWSLKAEALQFSSDLGVVSSSGSKTPRQGLALLLHSVSGDYAQLQELGINLDSDFYEYFDTQVIAKDAGIYKDPKQPKQKIGLKDFCDLVGYGVPLYLHNAGNDAAWTLKAALTVGLNGTDPRLLGDGLEGLVAIDFERNKKDAITEIGVARVLLADLRSLPAGDDPMSVASVRHAVILERIKDHGFGEDRWRPSDTNPRSVFNMGPSGYRRLRMDNELCQKAKGMFHDYKMSVDTELIREASASQWLRGVLQFGVSSPSTSVVAPSQPSVLAVSEPSAPIPPQPITPEDLEPVVQVLPSTSAKSHPDGYEPPHIKAAKRRKLAISDEPTGHIDMAETTTTEHDLDAFREQMIADIAARTDTTMDAEPSIAITGDESAARSVPDDPQGCAASGSMSQFGVSPPSLQISSNSTKVQRCHHMYGKDTHQVFPVAHKAKKCVLNVASQARNPKVCRGKFRNRVHFCKNCGAHYCDPCYRVWMDWHTRRYDTPRAYGGDEQYIAAQALVLKSEEVDAAERAVKQFRRYLNWARKESEKIEQGDD